MLELTYDDISCEDVAVKENVISLCEQVTEGTLYDEIDKSNTTINYFMKNTKPLHKFPSTSDIYDSIFEDKTIFKLNNRLYLNFSRATYKSDPSESYNYIYLNYNNNDKCDVKMNIKKINETVLNIVSTF
jgi:hypothetical protein